MENLIPFTSNDLNKITNQRSGELKFGEKMQTIPKGTSPLEYLKNSDATYVIIGVPEDVGVRANFGRPGAATAWESAIKGIANIQHNRFCKGSHILVLGTLNVSEQMQAAKNLQFNDINDRKKLNDLVTQIDKNLTHIICSIIKANKIPIIIGGGHNNAYGNIKGTALGLGKPINVINFDAHSDFRILEGRHSGNGFTYAFEEGFLKKYFIFGLHENYTSKNVLDTLKKLNDRINYNTYDEIGVRKEKTFQVEMSKALDFIKAEPFGIEIDLDSLPNIPSSAMTLSGFSVEEVRQFITHFGKHKNSKYIHICEGAPELGDEKNSHLVGKLIGYLVGDFIKSKRETAGANDKN